MKSILCTNPRRILNSSLPMLLPIFPYIFDHGRTYNLRPSQRNRIIEGESVYSVFGKKIYDFSNDSVVVDKDTGNTFDFWMLVPCGQCECCQFKKQNSLSQRLLFQHQQEKESTLFVTLTYNSDHLPVDGVSIRDCQLFKKRLNKYMSTYYPGTKLKYSIFSEYGLGGRPHYHLFIFGFPYSKVADSANYLYFNSLQILQYVWRVQDKTKYESYEDYLKHGYPVFRQTNFSKDKNSIGFVNLKIVNSLPISYVTKYISKGSNVPPGKHPNFRLISQNLGVEFASSLIPSILHNKSGRTFYTPRGTMKPKPVSFSTYYINKFFPTLSQSVPLEIRRNLNEIRCWSNTHKLSDIDSSLMKKIEIKYKGIESPVIDSFTEVSLRETPQEIMNRLLAFYKDIDNVVETYNTRNRLLAEQLKDYQPNVEDFLQKQRKKRSNITLKI